ncbi:MAG: hypothetical protein QNJ47_11915 [Nostocaceae cyanobacterium]|nr:hypothetical protein [Nostocaceae cyanobacterium]
MKFSVNAREGNPYYSLEGELISISDTVNKISVSQTQAEALDELGITLDNNTLKIEFLETGNPYLDPEGDRTKIGEKITEKVALELPLDNPPPSTLDIKASLEPFKEQGVNFAGRVNVTTPNGEKRSIPMTGRGTAALEGRANDAHAGFCTGSTCATFQERTALVLGVAAAAGASNEQIQSIGEKLRPLNDKFHGRGDILTYTIKASQTPQDKLESYTEFMKNIYPVDQLPPLLESIIKTGELHEAYYQKALTKMTPEELAIDKVDQEMTSDK